MLTHSLAFVALVWAASSAAVAVWGPAAAALLAAGPILLALPLLASRTPFAARGSSALMAAAAVWWLIGSGRIDHAGWLIPALTLGVLLHTVPGDLLTPSGVPLLAPFSHKRFAIPLFRTGSPIETLVGGAMTLATAVLAYGAFSATP